MYQFQLITTAINQLETKIKIETASKMERKACVCIV